MSNYVPPVDPLSETDRNSSLINQIAQVKSAIQNMKSARLQENPSQSNKAQAPAQASAQSNKAQAPVPPTHASLSDAEATKLNAKISTSSAYSANTMAFIPVPIQTSNAAPVVNASVVNAIYEIPLLIGQLSLKIAVEMLTTIASSITTNVAVSNNIAATEANVAEISIALGKAAREVQFQAAKARAIADAKAQGDANTKAAALGYGLGTGLGAIGLALSLFALFIPGVNLVYAAVTAAVALAGLIVGTILAVNSDVKAGAAYASADKLSNATSMSEVSSIMGGSSSQMQYGFLGQQGEASMASVSLALDVASIVLTLGGAAIAVAASRGVVAAFKTFTVFAKDSSTLVKAVTFAARVGGAAGQFAGLLDDMTRVVATFVEMAEKQPNAFKNGLIAPGLTSALEKTVGKQAAEIISISVSVLVQGIQMGMTAKQLRKAGGTADEDIDIVKEDDSASDADVKVDSKNAPAKLTTPLNVAPKSKPSDIHKRGEAKAGSENVEPNNNPELVATESNTKTAETEAATSKISADEAKKRAKADEAEEAEAKEKSVEEVVAKKTVSAAETKVAAAQAKVDADNTQENNAKLKLAHSELESAKQTLSNVEEGNTQVSKDLKKAELKAKASKEAAEEAEAEADLIKSLKIPQDEFDAAKVKLTKVEEDADIAMVKLDKARSDFIESSQNLKDLKNAKATPEEIGNAIKLKEDAKTKRDTAGKERMAAEVKLLESKSDYKNKKASFEEAKADAMNRNPDIKKAAQEQLAKAKESRIEAAEAEVDLAKGKLNDSKSKLTEANEKLANAQKNLDQLNEKKSWMPKKAELAEIAEARLQRDTAKMEQTAANRNKLIADAKVTASTKRQNLAIADKKANDLNIKAKNDEANAKSMADKADLEKTSEARSDAINAQTIAKNSRKDAIDATQKVNNQKLKNINKDLDKLGKTEHGKSMMSFAELIVEADTHKNSDWSFSVKKDSTGKKIWLENSKKTIEIDAPMKDKNGRVMRDADGIMMTEKKHVPIEKLDAEGKKVFVQRKEIARLNMIFSILTANLMIYNGGKVINATIQQSTFQMIKTYMAQMNAEITKNTKLAENAHAALAALNKLNSAQHNKLMAFLTQTMKIIAEIENSVLNTQQR